MLYVLSTEQCNLVEKLDLGAVSGEIPIKVELHSVINCCDF